MSAQLTPAQQHIHDAAFTAARDAAAGSDLSAHERLTLASAAGWRAARVARTDDAGQGAGFTHHIVLGAIAEGFVAGSQAQREAA